MLTVNKGDCGEEYHMGYSKCSKYRKYDCIYNFPLTVVYVGIEYLYQNN